MTTLARVATVQASMARMLIRAAEARNLDIDWLLRTAGVDRATIDEPDGRLRYFPYMRLWSLAAEACPEPGFGLFVAEQIIDATSLHVVGFAARNCPTMGEAILRAVRFSRLINENALITLDQEGDLAIITDGPRDPSTVWPAVYAEMALGAFAVLTKKWTQTAAMPRWVEFRHPRPDYADLYHRIFGPNVTFGAATNRIALPAEVLDAPLGGADDGLRDYLERQAEALLRALDSGDPILLELRRCIADALPSGVPRLAHAARILATSSRTLQRRLQRLGTSFDAVVDEVRKELALHTLRKPGVSIADAAFVTGYTDTQSFRRAVRRWTGKSPRALRDDPTMTSTSPV
jgi:AraC-like DNA-binding protein